MCEICKLAEATINGLEFEGILQAKAVETVRAVLVPPDQQVELSNKVAMLYYIAHLAVRWAIRLRIHPRDYLETMADVAKMEYEIETTRVLGERVKKISEN